MRVIVTCFASPLHVSDLFVTTRAFLETDARIDELQVCVDFETVLEAAVLQLCAVYPKLVIRHSPISRGELTSLYCARLCYMRQTDRIIHVPFGVAFDIPTVQLILDNKHSKCTSFWQRDLPSLMHVFETQAPFPTVLDFVHRERYPNPTDSKNEALCIADPTSSFSDQSQMLATEGMTCASVLLDSMADSKTMQAAHSKTTIDANHLPVGGPLPGVTTANIAGNTDVLGAHYVVACDERLCPHCGIHVWNDACSYVFCGWFGSGPGTGFRVGFGCGKSFCMTCGKKYCGQHFDAKTGDKLESHREMHDAECCAKEKGFISSDYCPGGHSPHCAVRW